MPDVPPPCPERPRRFRRLGGSPVAWSATAVFLTLLVVWSVVTPGFRSPDEAPHVNSVLRLAEGGGWPEPAEAFLSPGVIRAKTLTGFSAVDGQHGTWSGGTLLPGVRNGMPEEQQEFFALFSAQAVTPTAERLPFGELQPTRPVELWRHGDQMTQHPPLYYAVSAAVVRGVGALDWPFDRTLALMRLVSVAMVMWLPLMAFALVRTLTGNRRLADVAALLPLAVPQLAFLGGSVQNDALVVFLGGLATVLLARVLSGDRSWRTLLLVGATLGLGLFTKGSLLILVPVVGLAVVVGLRRAAALGWRDVLLRLAVVWGVGFALGGWWWALNIVRYGTVQPEGIPMDPSSDSTAQGGARSPLVEFAGIWADKMSTSFWGNFGLLELPLPFGAGIALTAVALVLIALSLRRRGARLALGILLLVSGLTAALVFWQTYQDHLVSGQYGGMQGRYLYGGLVALFAAVAVGLGTLGHEHGRLQRCLAAGVLPVVLAIAAFGLWIGFRGFYLEIDWTVGRAWRRMVDWSPAPDLGARGLLGLLVVLFLITFVLAVRAARRPERHEDGSRGERTTPRPAEQPAASLT